MGGALIVLAGMLLSAASIGTWWILYQPEEFD